MRRNYSNTAPPLTLQVTVDADDVVFTVASTAGYPAVPFTIAIERGTPNEEFCLVTAKDATTFTVTRGYDGTTGKAHTGGVAVIEHAIGAIDYDEANEMANLNGAGVIGSRPAASAVPQGFYYDTGNDKLYHSNGTAWELVRKEGDVTVRHAWTYTLPGDIKVGGSGGPDYLPPAIIARPTGQTASIVGYRWGLNAGTSFTFKILHSDTIPVGAWTTVVTGIVATGPTTYYGGAILGTARVVPAEYTLWMPEITAVSGSPVGGFVSLLVDVTV